MRRATEGETLPEIMMKKTLTCSLIALAFAGTAAQAQDATTHADHTAPQAASADARLPEEPTQDAVPATPDAVPPAADAGVTAGHFGDRRRGNARSDRRATAVTDAEVASYASAATKVQTIAADTALDDAAKQQQMAAAVTRFGPRAGAVQ